MALCPQCFNAPEYCECDPPFAGRSAGVGTRPPAPGAERVTDEAVVRLLDSVNVGQRPHVKVFVDAVRALGCWVENPPALRRDYVNVRPPVGHGRARLCSIHLRSGRIEFQEDTYLMAESIGVARHFDHLPAGDLAAMTPASDEDAAAAIALARVVLHASRGR